MAERSAISQVVNLGLEYVPGTQVATSRRLQSMDFETAVEFKVDGYRPQGDKFETVASTNKEWMSASMKGAPTYTEILYPLASVVTTPAAPTAILDSAIDTGGRRWIFEPSSTGTDNPLTYTMEQGSSVRAHKFGYGIMSDFSLSITRDKIAQAGKLMGQQITDAITMGGTTRTVSDAVTATTGTGKTITSASAAFVSGDIGKTISGTGIPAGSRIKTINSGTSVEIDQTETASGSGVTIVIGAVTTAPLVPIGGQDLTVYLDTTSGGLGTTKLSRNFQTDWGLANRFGPVWTVDQSQTSFATTAEIVPALTTKLLLEADAQGMTQLSGLRANTTYFMRILALGPVIYNSGVYASVPLRYSVQIDQAVQFRKTSAFKDEQGIYAIPYDLVGVDDAGWGKALHIEVVNKMTTL